jgi:hypothetical protein
VNLYETQTGIVLKEQIVGDKENELSRIQEFLTQELLKGRIVSADALHTQRTFCLGTILAGGEYLLIAKGNHPTLQEDLQLFFTEPPLDCQDWRTDSETNAGHGRLEQRMLIASTEREWLSGKRVVRRPASLLSPATGSKALILHARVGVWYHLSLPFSG